MMFHENRLPADIMPFFEKNSNIFNCRLLQIIGGTLWVNFFLMRVFADRIGGNHKRKYCIEERISKRFETEF